MDSRPFILTLRLDPDSQGFFDALRERHFPAERNFIGAHVTLFHALPGSFGGGIAGDIESVCARREPFRIHVKKLRSLGKGVAYVLESGELSGLRGDLAKEWRHFLTTQDAQKFSAHVTVQNKVTPERARRLLDDLERDFEPFEVRAEGLALWRYAGGPWEPAGEFSFGGEYSRKSSL